MNRVSVVLLLLAGLLLWVDLPADWSGLRPWSIFVQPRPGSWVLLVEESSERTPALARWSEDLIWQESLAARQLQFRIYDVDQLADESQIERAARKVGLPALVIVDPTGKVLDSQAITDQTDVDGLVKGATGL